MPGRLESVNLVAELREDPSVKFWTIGEVLAGRRGDKERLALLLDEPDLADEMMSYLKQELAVGS